MHTNQSKTNYILFLLLQKNNFTEASVFLVYPKLKKEISACIQDPAILDQVLWPLKSIKSDEVAKGKEGERGMR